jgi:hypothetical protein
LGALGSLPESIATATTVATAAPPAPQSKSRRHIAGCWRGRSSSVMATLPRAEQIHLETFRQAVPRPNNSPTDHGKWRNPPHNARVQRPAAARQALRPCQAIRRARKRAPADDARPVRCNA